MPDAADYRLKALECARRASEAGDDFHRKNYQQLADMWFEMARKADERAGISSGASDQKDVDEALATIRNAH